MVFSLLSLAFSGAADLARPLNAAASTRLSDAPNIWLTEGFLSEAAVAHMRALVPKEEAAYEPCIGQRDEFEFKKCTFLPVEEGDEVLAATLAKLEHTWNVDVGRLRRGGLPVIRYLPGAPPVGKHGDQDKHGTVPNATLVVYLTQSDRSAAGGATGQTIFPEAGVKVTPTPGAVLSFQNVDEAGAPHPRGKHLVSAVPADAASDRLVLQIPLAHENGTRPYAYPEHVSGEKKPGEHESMHGSAEQINAFKAALAAGMSMAVAFMAAKAGKFEVADEPALKAQAEATGKFSEEDFKPKEA
jgi:hypothetical protein